MTGCRACGHAWSLTKWWGYVERQHAAEVPSLPAEFWQRLDAGAPADELAARRARQRWSR